MPFIMPGKSPVIIPTSHHCHHELTQSDINFLIGTCIVIYVIWVVVLSICIYKWLKNKDYRNLEYYLTEHEILGGYHFIMSAITIFIIIFYLGYLISKHL